jgi:hypothetical protein
MAVFTDQVITVNILIGAGLFDDKYRATQL